MSELFVATRSLVSALGCEASVTVIGLCANGVLRGENKSIFHELAVTSGTDSDTIHELLSAQSQQISSSNRPNTPLLLKMSNTSHTAPDASLAQPPSPHHPQVVDRHAHEFPSASGHLTHCWAYTLCTGT